MEQMGTLLTSVERTIGQRHSFTQLLRIEFSVRQQLFDLGLIQHKLDGWAPSPAGLLLQQRSILELYPEVSKKARAQFYKIIRPDTLQPGLMDALGAHHLDGWLFPDRIWEHLANAIEHGSRWGEAGDVRCAMFYGSNAVMAVMRQPLPGPDYSSLDEEILRDNLRGSCRGSGLLSACVPYTAPVWGQTSPDGMFETVLLETRERTDRLFREWQANTVFIDLRGIPATHEDDDLGS